MVYNYVNFINIFYDKELLALNYSKLNAFILIQCHCRILGSIPDTGHIICFKVFSVIGYHKPTVVSKRLSLCSTVDLAPVILPYDLIIGTDDNISNTPMITPTGGLNSSYSDACGQWRYIDTVLLCHYITLNSYICYGYNGKWVLIICV
ncbi:hypothetical protein H8356DRAFT_1364251 [Neocallimastix lanati (nom. inval.)]|nr:hypothetical protein H8356DRAFT_1364251 [Neocallimastix sp. JGI-2020a]